MRLSLASLTAILCLAASAHALMVDWSTASWAAGSLTNSFDIDAGTAGNDVTVTVSGDTAGLQVATGTTTQTPAITSNLQGGFGAGHMSLQLGVNFNTDTEGVTVTIDFTNLYASGVSNVSFNIFDIDYSNGAGNTFQDVLRSIYATSTTGTQIAPAITTSLNNSSSGSGVNQVVTGLLSTSDTGITSGNANVTVSFNTTNIRSITFTYGSSNAFANPTYQHMALDNISYVPEAGTWSVGLFGYGLVTVSIAMSFHRKRRATISRRE